MCEENKDTVYKKQLTDLREQYIKYSLTISKVLPSMDVNLFSEVTVRGVVLDRQDSLLCVDHRPDNREAVMVVGSTSTKPLFYSVYVKDKDGLEIWVADASIPVMTPLIHFASELAEITGLKFTGLDQKS